MSAPAPPPLLQCTAVEAGYSATEPVLFGVDITVERGEIVALLGTNGAGKSTLLKVISHLLQPTGGTISFDGADVTHIGPLEATRRGIVQIPGDDAVFPTLTVAEHVRMTSFLCRDAAALEARTVTMLGLFPRLRSHWHHRAGDLSGGERRQLALATALLADPTLLLVDELSLGLAAVAVDELLCVVRAISADGCGVVIVDQSVDVAAQVAHRAYFLEKGEVRFSGPPEQLLDRTDVIRPIFLGAAAHDDGGGNRTDEPASGVSTQALSVRGLTKRFGGITAVEGVSFDVWPGAVVALVGPNGAGKTTLIDLVSGLLRTDEGYIALGSTDITRSSAQRRALLGLGRSFQDARLFPALTTAENVAVALESQLDVRDHLASTLALPVARAMEATVVERVDELIALFGLHRWRDVPAAALSTGTRRVVELAMALAHQPRVLLLDEPSAGLAQGEAQALHPLLMRLRRETGCSMVLVEHDLRLVRSIADEVIVMETGRVVDRGTTCDVLGVTAAGQPSRR